MGTIAHAFETGGQSAKKGLFSNLVTLSRADGVVNDAERAMLDRVARRLSLTKEQAEEIMAHPEEYPMVPPSKIEERIERYIQFIRLAFVDGVVDETEHTLIARYGIALGFEENEANEKASAILAQVKEGAAPDVILNALV